MTRSRVILGLAVMIVAGRATNVRAQTQDDDLKSLRGLPGVGVIVRGLPDRSTDPAVNTTEEIRKDVEGQLAQAGIRVLTRTEVETTPSRPSLQIDFGFVRAAGDVDFYIVRVAVRQWAVLGSGQALSVRTFEDGTAEWTKAADRKDRVRNAVKEEVSRFVNAWGIANRK